MDRTTLTAYLKPLERRGLVQVEPDTQDRRSRRLRLTEAGRDRLARAVPAWRRTHDAVDVELGALSPDQLRAGLNAIAFGV